MLTVRKSQISVHYAPRVETLNSSQVRKVNNYLTSTRYTPLTAADNTNSKTQHKDEMHKPVSMRPNSAIAKKKVEVTKALERPNSAAVVKNIDEQRTD